MEGTTVPATGVAVLGLMFLAGVVTVLALIPYFIFYVLVAIQRTHVESRE